MMRLVLCFVALVGCGERDDESARLAAVAAKVEAAEGRNADEAAETAELDLRAEVLRAKVDIVVKDHAEVERELREAKERYEQAARLGRSAQAGLDEAMQAYRRAEQSYRRVSMMLLMAAASDLVGQGLCGQVKSTQQFRRELRAEGVDLTDKDVDHIFPRAAGGVDHPWNYQLLDKSLNRSLGASVTEKLMRWPLPTIAGMVVSALAKLACDT